MAIRNIVKNGDDVLRKKCRDVINFDGRLHYLLDDMKDTMHNAQGVGLAAPQVGILRNVCIIETEETGLIECVNPKIIDTKGKHTDQEGCLSCPGESGYVERPAIVKFQALDRHGKPFEMVVKGLAARAICHETDHLVGTLFVDKIIPDYEGEENND